MPSMKQPCLGRQTWYRNSSVQVRPQLSVRYVSLTQIHTERSAAVFTDCSRRHSPGIDVNILDRKGLTALGIVKDMPSQKSREIAALILGKTESCGGQRPFDCTSTSCDTVNHLPYHVPTAGHMSGKHEINLPPPPVPPPQESPVPQKKSKIQPIVFVL